MLGCRALGAFLTVLFLLPAINANGQSAGTSARLGILAQAIEDKGLTPIVSNERERQKWEEIEELIFLDDNDGQPIHPTLRWLWQWLDTSGHMVFVDIRQKRGDLNLAGSFSIEKFDPRGARHVCVIRLNLNNIDLANVGQENKLKNGLIPFEGLGKTERYVEVLGHEMSHAVHILSDHELSNSVIHLVNRTNEILLDKNRQQQLDQIEPEFRKRLSKRDDLLKILESKAADMEKVVWHELFNGLERREKISAAGADR